MVERLDNVSLNHGSERNHGSANEGGNEPSRDGDALSGAARDEAGEAEGRLDEAAVARFEKDQAQTDGSPPSSCSPDVAVPVPLTAWAPLMIPMYRSFWIAGLFSNIGTWMHETGAQWLMTSLEGSPTMVASVRTAMTLPIFCLALPAGVWADRFDRRRWLMGTQLLLFALASTMTLLAWLQWITPALLLVLTALMGIAMILNQPAWQALTPELVPAAMVPSAVQTGSVSFNLARTLGPAMAGVLIAYVGFFAPFLFNALSFLGVVWVLSRWRPEPEDARHRASPEFMNELKKGLFVIRNTPVLRNVLLRTVVFAFSSSILWSLLPLVATQKLGFRERGFGVCLALIGAGAVTGFWFLPELRRRLSSGALLLWVQAVFAIALGLIAATNSRWLIVPMLVLLGACWMSTMTTFNATAQVHLPRKFRARGMSAYVMSLALGMAGGSFLWGQLAGLWSIDGAYWVASTALLLSAFATRSFSIGKLDPAT